MPNLKFAPCKSGRASAPATVLHAVATTAAVLALVSCSSERPRTLTSPPPPPRARAPVPKNQASGPLRYRFRPAPRLDHFYASVCFDGRVPKRLAPPTTRAAPAITRATLRGQRVLREDGNIDLSRAKTGDCVEYRVDTSPNSRTTRGNDDRAFLVSPDSWFWVPKPHPKPGTIKVAFDLPEKMSVAVPWARAEDDRKYPYRPSNSLFFAKADAVFGTFPYEQERTLKTVTGAPSTQRIVGLHAIDKASQRTLLNWVNTGADTVVKLLGGFPRRRSLIALSSTMWGDGTFGLSVRGGGSMNVLMVPAEPKAKDLANDWTTTHEMLHFSLPPIERRGAWLYEGFVTYFTTLARARAGVTTEDYGWYELLEGLQRGTRSSTDDNLPLAEASARMHQDHRYWHVYWGGAAIALLTDVALHRQGGSLTESLRNLVAKNLSRDADVTTHEALALFDECSGTTIPSTIAQAALVRPFPATQAATQFLGVKLSDDGQRAVVDEEAPGAKIRRAIMATR